MTLISLCDTPLLLIAIVGIGIIAIVAWWVGRVPNRGRAAVATALGLSVLMFVGQVRVDSALSAEKARLREMLEGIAPTYAHEMQEHHHSQVSLQTAPDDPTYLGLIQVQKEYLRLNPAVADIYTVRPDAEGKLHLIVDSETDYDRNGRYDGDREQRTEIGRPYSPDSTVYNDAFRNGHSEFTESPITDEWGTWVTATAPIFNDDGKVEAVVGIDYPAAQWMVSIQKARSTIYWMIAFVWATILGTYLTVMLLLRSLMEKEIARKELEVAKEQSDAGSLAKSEFLANMSHEIRTPMTAILGFTDLLADDTLTPTVRREHIQTVRRNGEHLIGIINDILDLSKIEAGRMLVEAVELDPVQLVEDVMSLMRVHASAKHLEVHVNCEWPLPARIASDPTRLRQILVNLVGNAIKFTEVGQIDVAVRCIPGNKLEFAVSDTGIGIDSAQMPRLFQPFQQGDTSTTRKFGGTGLGLTISKRLAVMLGGDLIVTSMTGHGSTFRLQVAVGLNPAPMALGPTCLLQPKLERATPSTKPLAGLRILLAEDGQDNRRLIVFHLKRAGATVDVVENGQLAVDAIQGSLLGTHPTPPPDVVLMDMSMPVLDGYSATRTLRQAGVQLPVIALTAHAMAGDREKCMEAGCSDFATKPIDPAALFATIVKHAPARITQSA